MVKIRRKLLRCYENWLKKDIVRLQLFISFYPYIKLTMGHVLRTGGVLKQDHKESLRYYNIARENGNIQVVNSY